MGGEKMLLNSPVSSLKGSPPRGRGKADLQTAGSSSPGITPAWAGKSSHYSDSLFSSWDHPRVGGEKYATVAAEVVQKGSPPRGRGKVQNIGSTSAKTGITPAWAGKSWQLRTPTAAIRDHPRVGGEKPMPQIFSSHSQGSPPRGRGKDIVVKGHSSKEGITPAWAGKSTCRGSP